MAATDWSPEMTKRADPKIHFSGAIRTPTMEMSGGYPVCCSGAPAIRAAKLGRTTEDVAKVTCFRCMDVIDNAIGGPVTCPRECSECGPKHPRAGFIELHHFSDIVETIDDDPDHPAVTLFGRDAWYRCKHCSAWALDEYAASEAA